MKSFEFEVIENLGAPNGQIEGYFAVPSEHFKTITSAGECLDALDITDQPEDLMIPVLNNEYSLGVGGVEPLARIWRPARGLVTFGTDVHPKHDRDGQRTHLGVLVREFLKEKPGFIAPLVALPDSMTSGAWEICSPLHEAHLRYGSVAVRGSTCTITIDETVEPLPDRAAITEELNSRLKN